MSKSNKTGAPKANVQAPVVAAAPAPVDTPVPVPGEIQISAEQLAAAQAEAELRKALVQKLTELKWPGSLDDLSNEQLQAALDAHAEAVKKSETEKPNPENKLENISKVASKEKVPALWIRSVPESFMRCGRRFTRDGYGVALDVLTEEEIQRLKDEPNLVVEEVEAILD